MYAVQDMPSTDCGRVERGSTTTVISALLLCWAVTKRRNSSWPESILYAEYFVVLYCNENEVFMPEQQMLLVGLLLQPGDASS